MNDVDLFCSTNATVGGYGDLLGLVLKWLEILRASDSPVPCGIRFWCLCDCVLRIHNALVYAPASINVPEVMV